LPSRQKASELIQGFLLLIDHPYLPIFVSPLI
jgi:hypothetical protein